MKKKYYFAFSMLTCVILLISYSCNKNSSSSTYTPPPVGGTSADTISMASMTFTPNVLTVSNGTVIKFVNNDPYNHWVLSDDGTRFNSNAAIAPGKSFTYTASTSNYSTPDTVGYYCYIHGHGMHGTLIITP